MKIVIVSTLICTTCLCGFACLFALLSDDSGLGFYLGLAACLLFFSLWLSLREDPVDPCIPAEETMVISEIHPSDWQLEEIMTIRLEDYLKRTWKRLHGEWGYDPAGQGDTNLMLHGFAMATRQTASQFNINLEKP